MFPSHKACKAPFQRKSKTLHRKQEQEEEECQEEQGEECQEEEEEEEGQPCNR
jgi:hypothetical protein